MNIATARRAITVLQHADIRQQFAACRNGLVTVTLYTADQAAAAGAVFRDAFPGHDVTVHRGPVVDIEQAPSAAAYAESIHRAQVASYRADLSGDKPSARRARKLALDLDMAAAAAGFDRHNGVDFGDLDAAARAYVHGPDFDAVTRHASRRRYWTCTCGAQVADADTILGVYLVDQRSVPHICPRTADQSN